MYRRMMFPIFLGLVGAVILAGLGNWQLQRMAWKNAILADISARMQATPSAIPANPDPDVDNYRRVQIRGILDGPELHVLITRNPDGPGFRVIQKLNTETHGDIMIDLGTVPEAAKNTSREGGEVLIEGNLIWPDETDGYTPDADQVKNIWFARDVALMAEALETAPIMVVASATDPQLEPRPWQVGINIPNDHLQYAITWFSLMVVWLVMTGYLLWQVKRDDKKA